MLYRYFINNKIRESIYKNRCFFYIYCISQLAIGDLLKYRTDRTNLIKSTDQRIHENIQDYIATGIGDGAAKKYALELCKAVEQAEMNLINLLKKDRRK